MGPSSSLASGKMVSWWMMMVLMISLTWAWQDTWSWLSGVGMSVGPKHMARLYGSIMFSSLYWDRLEEQGRERWGERDQEKGRVKRGHSPGDSISDFVRSHELVSVCWLTGWGRRRGSAWRWGLIEEWSGGSYECTALSHTGSLFLE